MCETHRSAREFDTTSLRFNRPQSQVRRMRLSASCATMPFMNLQAIVNELRDQRDRIQQAIDALERITNSTTSAAKPAGRKPRRHMSADARRRIGLAMKKRWAERKKGKKVTTSSAKKTRHGGISAAGRKRISEMMKKRWAAKKKMEAA